MSARISLTPTGGPSKGREFLFTARTICTVGRSDDCLLRIRGDAANLTVSRRHCLLDINPPAVRVWDLGSLNGTFVNDRMIGQRQEDTPSWAGTPVDPKGVELHDGDRLALGGLEFLVGIQCDLAGEGVGGHDEGPTAKLNQFAACC